MVEDRRHDHLIGNVRAPVVRIAGQDYVAGMEVVAKGLHRAVHRRGHRVEVNGAPRRLRHQPRFHPHEIENGGREVVGLVEDR